MTAERAVLAFALATTLCLGALLVTRSGYSPDEEITVFAVQGIRAHGTPVLPSGLTYWRGAVFSYSSWLAGLGGGFTLETYRALALLFAAGCVMGTFLLARRISLPAATIGALLLSALPAFVSMSAYARSYSAFPCVSVLALWCLSRGNLTAFALLAFAARSFQEMGVALAFAPLAWAITAARPLPWRLTRVVGIAALLVLAHLLLAALQRFGIGGEAARAPGAWIGLPLPILTTAPILELARMPDWIALAAMMIGLLTVLRASLSPMALAVAAICAVASALLSFGTIAVIAIGWWIARPSAWPTVIRVSFGTAALGWLGWIAIVWWRADVVLSPRIAVDLLLAGLQSHTDGVRMLATQTPVTSLILAAGVVMSVRMPDDTAAATLRTVALLFWLQVAAFGLFGVDARTRFISVMSPMLAVLCGAALAGAVARAGAVTARLGRVAGLVATAIVGAGMLLVVLEQEELVRPMTTRPATDRWWAAWTPAVAIASLEPTLRSLVRPGDILITNDELAAQMHGLTAAYWWARDDTTATSYGRKDGLGQLRSIYGGGLVVDENAVQRLVAGRGSHGVSIISFVSNKFGDLPDSLQNPGEWKGLPTLSQTPDWRLLRIPPEHLP